MENQCFMKGLSEVFRFSPAHQSPTPKAASPCPTPPHPEPGVWGQDSRGREEPRFSLGFNALLEPRAWQEQLRISPARCVSSSGPPLVCAEAVNVSSSRKSPGEQPGWALTALPSPASKPPLIQGPNPLRSSPQNLQSSPAPPASGFSS